jgi:hypothetical protein
MTFHLLADQDVLPATVHGLKLSELLSSEARILSLEDAATALMVLTPHRPELAVWGLPCFRGPQESEAQNFYWSIQ